MEKGSSIMQQVEPPTIERNDPRFAVIAATFKSTSIYSGACYVFYLCSHGLRSYKRTLVKAVTGNADQQENPA
jgi:hypothetical protein